MARVLPFVVSAMALVVGVAALAISLRQSDSAAGRLLELPELRAFTVRQPIPYALDDFELMKLDDSSFVALYIYPPGYFGHTQGCTIRWQPDASFNATQYPPGATPGPAGQSPGVEVSAVGLWEEGCGGAKWDATGHYLFGPALGDLDRFPVTLRNGRLWVDTRHLICQTGHACERVHKVGR